VFPEESKVCGGGAGADGGGATGVLGCRTIRRRGGGETGGGATAEEEVGARGVAVTGRAGLGRGAVTGGATVWAGSRSGSVRMGSNRDARSGPKSIARSATGVGGRPCCGGCDVREPATNVTAKLKPASAAKPRRVPFMKRASRSHGTG
jgi:hypothetical protein